jgi:hypothetical protein
MQSARVLQIALAVEARGWSRVVETELPHATV